MKISPGFFVSYSQCNDYFSLSCQEGQANGYECVFQYQGLETRLQARLVGDDELACDGYEVSIHNKFFISIKMSLPRNQIEIVFYSQVGMIS